MDLGRAEMKLKVKVELGGNEKGREEEGKVKNET